VRTFTRWNLEQTDPAQLRRAKVPGPEVRVARVGRPSPEFSRYLYTAVGGDWYWIDRLGWTWHQWRDWLDRPGAETWVAWAEDSPAGYAELDPQAEGRVELAYFGLLPGFIGLGLGGHLLSVALDRAWTLADRWPDREPTRRVWVHTQETDGPAALANYQARGLRIFSSGEETEDLPASPPGPWPGAQRP
jgi:GNAT superfamily N-acetyltransferase